MAIYVPDQINNDITFNGKIIFRDTVAMGEEVLNGNSINPAVPVPVDSVETIRETVRYVDGAIAVGTNYYNFDVMGMSGNLVYFYATLLGAPTTTDELDIDLEKYDGSWATVLAAVINFDSLDASPIGKAATISVPAYVNGTKYRLKVVGTGSTSPNDLCVKAGYVAQGYV